MQDSFLFFGFDQNPTTIYQLTPFSLNHLRPLCRGPCKGNMPVAFSPEQRPFGPSPKSLRLSLPLGGFVFKNRNIGERKSGNTGTESRLQDDRSGREQPLLHRLGPCLYMLAVVRSTGISWTSILFCQRSLSRLENCVAMRLPSRAIYCCTRLANSTGDSFSC